MFRQFDYLKTVDSTNDYLKKFVEAREPRMVVAQEQTEGKGRFGHGWYSPLREGLYVSYLLYPDWEVERASFLNMIAGLSVANTIHEMGGTELPLRLKPPNDVYILDKKVCGILSEMSSLNNRINWAVVGIGVNLYHQKFPEELESRATSLHLEGVSVSHPLDFCDHLTHQLESLYHRLECGGWEAVQGEHDKYSQSVQG
ncbi:MAG: biotin--[acetyl-CoA-carboxylase] ligase [Acidobacteriota bacterium]